MTEYTEKFCKFCGAQIAPGQKFCAHCGKATAWGTVSTISTPSLTTASAPTVSSQTQPSQPASPPSPPPAQPAAFNAPASAWRCPSCGKENVYGSAFCNSCGAKIAATNVSQPVQPVLQNQKGSFWWFLLPIFFNIVGGAIGYFAFRHKNRSFASTLLSFGLLGFCITLGFAFFIGFFSLVVQILILFPMAYVSYRGPR